MQQPSRYGVQPVKAELRAQRWSTAAIARELGCPHTHIINVCAGVTAPSHRVRDRLPVLLSTPLSQLFTRDALAAEYKAKQGPGGHERAHAEWVLS